MSTDGQRTGSSSSDSGAVTSNLVITLAVVLTLVAVVSISWYLVSLRCRPPVLSVIDDPAQLDDRHLELLELDPPSWVRQYSPERSSAGYNLVLYRRRIPLIIDMNGRIVHSWPEVRVTGRARLNSDGSLAVVGIDNLIKEYSWEGELRWHFQLPDKHDSPHHDLIRMKSGNYLILARDGHRNSDFLLEVDRDGQVAWEWRFEEHVAAFPTGIPTSRIPPTPTRFASCRPTAGSTAAMTGSSPGTSS